MMPNGSNSRQHLANPKLKFRFARPAHNPMNKKTFYSVTASKSAGHHALPLPPQSRNTQFEDIADAHQYVDTGRKRGSVVIDLMFEASESGIRYLKHDFAV